MITKDNNKDCDMYASYAGVYLGKEIFSKKYLEGSMDHEFEGKKFLIPKNYDSYLKHYYGDYMQLPPKEKRVSHPVVSIEFPDE